MSLQYIQLDAHIHLDSSEQVISTPHRPLHKQHTQRDENKIYTLSGIRTRNPSNRTRAGLRLKLIFHERRCRPLLPLAPQSVSKCNGCLEEFQKLTLLHNRTYKKKYLIPCTMSSLHNFFLAYFCKKTIWCPTWLEAAPFQQQIIPCRMNQVLTASTFWDNYGIDDTTQ